MMVKGNRLLQLALLLVAAPYLSACGSAPSGAPASSQGSGSVAPAAPAVPFNQARFAFAPVTGAPASVLTRISSELGKEAFAQHVTLVPSGDPSATYVVKGYLSAVGDSSGTILVYVWDIFDTAGRRVHRISGQETSTTGASNDPWAGVDGATATSVAQKTMTSIVAWGASR